MHGQRQERSLMMEMKKASLNPAIPSRERGLLGPLALPGDAGGLFHPPQQDAGVFAGRGQVSRGSLMEVSGGGHEWPALFWRRCDRQIF